MLLPWIMHKYDVHVCIGPRRKTTLDTLFPEIDVGGPIFCSFFQFWFPNCRESTDLWLLTCVNIHCTWNIFPLFNILLMLCLFCFITCDLCLMSLYSFQNGLTQPVLHVFQLSKRKTRNPVAFCFPLTLRTDFSC